MLTAKQSELLLFINQRMAQDGVAPSFDEMKLAINLRSKSGVHRLIAELEERGFIRKLPHRARAIEVLRLPEALSTAKSNMIELGPKRILAQPNRKLNNAPRFLSLPLYGRIAAGTPIESLRDPSIEVDVPASLLGPGEHYALEVDGDSMQEAGLLDGDTVIIRKSDTADNGEIVVALIDQQEATLKTLQRQAGIVNLLPANAAYKTQSYNAERVRIQGKLVGLLRRY